MKKKKQKFQMMTNKPDANGNYVFTNDDGYSMIHLDDNDIPIGKLVYATFNEDGRKDLDAKDPSWNVEYIDGNISNNYIKNLKYVKHS